MGKRGPRIGSKYRRRIVVAPRIAIESDRQLVEAQNFNERLDKFLSELELRETYPVNALEPDIIEQVVAVTAILQEAIVEGIEVYSVRRSPSRRAVEAGEEEPFLPGRFDIGAKRGRSPRE